MTGGELLGTVASELGKEAVKETAKTIKTGSLKNKLQGLIQKLMRTDREYKFTSYHKHVTIFSDGHGIVQISPTLKVQKDSFDKIQHFIGLSDCGLKNSKLNPVSSLIRRFERNKKSRFYAQTLCCKLISLNGEDIQHAERWLKIVPDKEEDSNKKRPFFIEFRKKTFNVGDEIKYRWSYSYPRLYPTKRSEMYKFNLGEDGERDLDYCKATLRLKSDIDFLAFSISLEDGIELDRLPELWVCDQQTKKEKLVSTLRKEEDSYYTRYSTSAKNGKHGHNYILKWYLK